MSIRLGLGGNPLFLNCPSEKRSELWQKAHFDWKMAKPSSSVSVNWPPGSWRTYLSYLELEDTIITVNCERAFKKFSLFTSPSSKAFWKRFRYSVSDFNLDITLLNVSPISTSLVIGIMGNRSKWEVAPSQVNSFIKAAFCMAGVFRVPSRSF